MASPPNPGPARRRDATRNRQRLLEVADTAFRANGLEASLEDIARRSGVGIGTLYRHFPTRDDLVVALVAADLERLAALADAADDPDALAGWMAEVADHTVTYRGLAEAVVAARDSPGALGHACTRLHAAGADLVRRAQARGFVRADARPDDGVDLASAIAWITERDGNDRRRRRLLTTAVDGLRPPS